MKQTYASEVLGIEYPIIHWTAGRRRFFIAETHRRCIEFRRIRIIRRGRPSTKRIEDTIAEIVR